MVNRHFKIRDTEENGNTSVRKLKGLKRDSEILFVAPPPPPLPPPIDVANPISKLNNDASNVVRISNTKYQSSKYKDKPRT